jgi:hypothetical protein
MPPLLRPLLLAAALVALAPSARAVTIVTLALDPAQSALVPEVGAPEALTGTITLRLGALPLGGVSTTFDVIGLALAAGGASIGLDPAIANPGLGVLTPAGAFLIPTLFVRIDDGAPQDLAIPDVSGNVVFGAGGASLAALTTSFAIATGGPAGLVTVNVTAVPEPAAAALLALGLAALGARRAARTEAPR